MAEMHRWEGLRELEENLRRLGEDVRERGVRFMMSNAAVPMRDEAKRRAPVLKRPDPRRKAGTLRENIKIWRKRNTRYAVTYYVGLRALSKRAVRMFRENNTKGGRLAKSTDNPNDPFYWRFQELGTSRQAAQPFLRPAFEAKKLESAKVALDSGRDYLRRAAARLKRVKKGK